ncbi:MAG: uracil-DNA glycosylase [Candidatus Brachytrichaceae bacterium NZ_4S206]|jgi:uracil-DNA glycosylase
MNRVRLRTLLAALAHPLAALPHDVFNPYADYCPALERPDAPRIRLANLARYLRERAYARIALIGEAPGYRGCRFTGLPFTCEAQLRALGNTRYRTTSLRGDYDERSARDVWRAIGTRGDVIFWNAFPWHPHQPGRPLSNRQPSAAELRAGCFALKLFLEWKRPERVIAVGRVAERAAHGGRSGYLRAPSLARRPARL